LSSSHVQFGGASRDAKDQLKELMEWTEEQDRKERKAEEWAQKQKPNLSEANDVVTEIHDISTRRRDFLFIVIFMGVVVSITTSSLLDMILQPPSARVITVSLIGLSAILVSPYIFNHFVPAPVFAAQFNAYFSHEDLMFFASPDSDDIRKFMIEGAGIRDFQSFAQRFLTSLGSLCKEMFGVTETRREMGADTGDRKVDADYPSWHLNLYLPDFIFREQTIENVVEFRIYPHTYQVAEDKAARRLSVAFSLRILNPEHPYADEFLKMFYEYRLPTIPKWVGLALSSQLNYVIRQASH
jgi:hypothetical protein